MKKSDAFEHFGGPAATARAIGISHQSVSKWGETVPTLHAVTIELVTKGKLRAIPPEHHEIAEPEAEPAA